MSVESSPFTANRFEFQDNNVYFLESSVLAKIRAPKPIYIVGGRGTGKTTLLKSLSYRERIRNDSLRQQVGDDPLADGVLGLYLKVPDIQFQLLDDWASSEGASYAGLVHQLSSLYLDMYWVEALLVAIGELRDVGRISFSSTKEVAAIRAIIGELGEESVASVPHSTHALLRVLRAKRRRFERRIQTNGTCDQIVGEFGTIGQPGSLGRSIAPVLFDLIGEGCHLKIGLDEAESFSDSQRRMINGWVRTTSWPVFPVLSFVRLPNDVTQTHLDALTVEKADREIVELDSLGSEQFRRLVEGVVNVRLEKNGTDARFSVSTTFGRSDLNQNLHRLLSRSVSIESSRLVELAREFAKGDAWRDIVYAEDDPGSAPPIWQAWIAKRLDLEPPFHDDRNKSIPQFRAELRKKAVAAYLGICREYEMDPRYSGSQMLMGTSDLCIRDFLCQVDEVYLQSHSSLDDFCSSVVELEVQWKSLASAAEKKYLSIPRFACGNARKSLCLVAALGRIAAGVQVNPQGADALRTPERGWFEIIGSLRSGRSDLLGVIESTAEAGFIRIERSDDATMRFRLHRSLAAYFGVSYRGPYSHSIRLEQAELERVVSSGAKPDLASEVENILERLGVRTHQLGLFGNVE